MPMCDRRLIKMNYNTLPTLSMRVLFHKICYTGPEKFIDAHDCFFFWYLQAFNTVRHGSSLSKIICLLSISILLNLHPSKMLFFTALILWHLHDLFEHRKNGCPASLKCNVSSRVPQSGQIPVVLTNPIPCKNENVCLIHWFDQV